jgi:hypothetical protein
MLRILGLCTVVAAATAAYLTIFAGPRPAISPSIMEATVGGVRLRFDPALLPEGGARSGANLDLVTVFPEFRPVPRSGKLAPAPETLVTFRIEPQDATVDPSQRASKLYARFLRNDSWSHPGGLITRRFETGTPYENEDLYLAPPEGRRFAARCQTPPAKPDGLPDTCLWDFRMNGLDVQMRFAPDLLSYWELLVDRGHNLVAALIRP